MSPSFLPRPRLRDGARRGPGRPGPAPLRPVRLADGDRRLAHMAASLLLAYPDRHTIDAARQVRTAVAHLPEPVAGRLVALATTLTDGDPHTLRADYVTTFDLTRRCTLHLTYHATGDTRRRGAALLRFAEAYRAVGWKLNGGELPDHLGCVLEMSARSDGDGARIAGALLATHREGIEVLRIALADRDSPWLAAVEAVCLTLSPVDAGTLDRVAALVAAGPPAELVGTEAPPWT